MRIECNRCKKNQNSNQLFFNSNNESSTSLNSTKNNYVRNKLLNENFNNNIDNNFFDNMYPMKYSHSYSPKNKKRNNVKRKKKHFCFNCDNLNFGFRTNCNRCQLTKTENQKIIQKCINNNKKDYFNKKNFFK